MPATNGSVAARTAQQLPDMGPNKIQQALDDYDHMVADLAATKKSLSAYVDIANALRAENDALKSQCKAQTDFLRQELEAVANHRDRINAALQGYIVRYRMIRKTIEDAEHEALEAGLMKEPAAPSTGSASPVGLPRNQLQK
jgi:chromosome segregation ATPase